MANNSSATSLDNRYEMPVFWYVIYMVESFLVCFGNSLSIVVFWRRRRSLKRTSYLLINLAVSDLSVGVGMACQTGVMLWTWDWSILYITTSINALTHFASILSLTLVSLETAFAMVFPFRHRTTGPRAYCFVVTLVWFLAAVFPVLFAVRAVLDNTNRFDLPSRFIFIALCGMCLVLIASSYLLIWFSVSKRSTSQMRERANQRKKLAMALFVVTVLSLMTWIPGQLFIFQRAIEAENFPEYVTRTLYALLLSNSFLNPLVYTFRLPEFRNEVKLIIRKSSWCNLEPTP